MGPPLVPLKGSPALSCSPSPAISSSLAPIGDELGAAVAAPESRPAAPRAAGAEGARRAVRLHIYDVSADSSVQWANSLGREAPGGREREHIF